jgi:hypothetical protein
MFKFLQVSARALLREYMIYQKEVVRQSIPYVSGN